MNKEYFINLPWCTPHVAHWLQEVHKAPQNPEWIIEYGQWMFTSNVQQLLNLDIVCLSINLPDTLNRFIYLFMCRVSIHNQTPMNTLVGNTRFIFPKGILAGRGPGNQTQDFPTVRQTLCQTASHRQSWEPLQYKTYGLCWKQEKQTTKYNLYALGTQSKSLLRTESHTQQQRLRTLKYKIAGRVCLRHILLTGDKTWLFFWYWVLENCAFIGANIFKCFS